MHMEPTMQIWGEANENNEELKRLFNQLEAEWDSVKRSTACSRKRPRSSTATTSCSHDHHRTITHSPNSYDNNNSKLLENLHFRLLEKEVSPRNLMYTLQARALKDLAVEEIIRDRGAALETDKLKGRRLFEEEEKDTDHHDHEVVINKLVDSGGGRSSVWWRWCIDGAKTGWLALVLLLLFALCFFSINSSFGSGYINHVHDYKLNLVPT